MGRQTAILLTPTLDECLHLAKDPDIDLPPNEAKKFWAHYETNGWRVAVGKTTTPMKSLRGAMMGWSLRWRENGGRVDANGHSRPGLSGMDKRILSDELGRILPLMKMIRDKYDGLKSWSEEDKKQYRLYKNRVNEIRSKLGVLA